MQITATEAKNRFGYVCAQAKIEPVIVEKDGRPDSVVVSYEDFQVLQAAADKRSMAQRKKEFNETYKSWIAVQNQHFETHGLWCNGLVSWMEKS
jgi:prevent-host-death family protein